MRVTILLAAADAGAIRAAIAREAGEGYYTLPCGKGERTCSHCAEDENVTSRIAPVDTVVAHGHEPVQSGDRLVRLGATITPDGTHYWHPASNACFRLTQQNVATFCGTRHALTDGGFLGPVVSSAMGRGVVLDLHSSMPELGVLGHGPAPTAATA
ncbi:MAG: hypothetical protein KGL39_29390 [Patescibacteria group bacterium]|nr:hypothetical protein [Patescibacteria group bacterium]